MRVLGFSFVFEAILICVFTFMPFMASSATLQVNCVGDGIADDTQCLKGYFSSGSNEIVFPYGKTYKVTKTIPVWSETRVIGNQVLIYSNALIHSIFRVQGQNVTLDNLRIANTFSPRSDSARPASLIMLTTANGDGTFSSTSNITLSNSTLYAPEAIAGLLMDSPNMSDVKILRNTFSQMHWGILVNKSKYPKALAQSLQAHTNNVKIFENKFKNIKADGVQINSPVYGGLGSAVTSDIPGIGAHNIRILNNEVTGYRFANSVAGFCLSVAGARDVHIIGNRLSNCKWQAIHVEDHSQDVVIRDNVIDTIVGHVQGDVGTQNFWVKSGKSGVSIIDSKNIFVLRNTILNAVDSGIELLSRSEDTADIGIVISGNNIKGTGKYGISIFAVPAPGELGASNLLAYIGASADFSENFISDSIGHACYYKFDPSWIKLSKNSPFRCN